MTQSKIKQNKLVAITGGIGSGKSEVCRIIAKKMYPVFSCDEIYSELITKQNFSTLIENYFPGTRSSDGTIDKNALASQVFADKDKLDTLTQITNPIIMDEAMKRMQEYTNDITKLVFCEVPLLFENKYEKNFDQVIVVLRDRDKRIDAINKRNNMSNSEIEKRIISQINYDIIDFSMYYVIHNNFDLEVLQQNTTKTINKILEQFNL